MTHDQNPAQYGYPPSDHGYAAGPAGYEGGYPAAPADYGYGNFGSADPGFAPAEYSQPGYPQPDYSNANYPPSEYPQADHAAGDHGQAIYGQANYGGAEYGQADYSQAGYPSSSAQTDWSQPGYSQVDPSSMADPMAGAPQNWDYSSEYPQGDNPGQGYPLAHYAQWGNVQAPAAVVPRRRTSMRGSVSLALALAALGISLMITTWGSAAYKTALQLNGGVPPDASSSSPGVQAALTTFGLSIFAQLIPTGLGIAAFIVGITALKTTSRGFGIGGIVVAIVAPFVSFLLFMGLAVAASA